jgi:hypothetical protein
MKKFFIKSTLFTLTILFFATQTIQAHQDEKPNFPEGFLPHVFTEWNKIYNSNTEGFFISQDSGNTFKEIGDSNIAEVLFVDHGVIYANTHKGELQKSTDGGVTFNTIETLKEKTTGSVFAKDKKIYAGTSEGLFISQNGGKTFAHASGLDKGKTINSVFADQEIVYVSNNEGLLISENDGKTFKKMPNSPTLHIYSIFINNGILYVAAGSLFSKEAGKPFRELTGLPQYKSVYSVFVHQNKIYAGIYDGGVVISEDNGKTFN